MSATILTAAGPESAATPTRPIEEALRAGRRRRSRAHARVLLALGAALALLLGVDLAWGDRWYTAGEVLAVLLGRDAPGASFAIGELRLPRVLMGLGSGLALGLAGRSSQVLLRNPLATPDIIGVTSGSSAAAVVAILLWGWSGLPVALVALVAGLATAAAILALSGGGARGGRIVLIGIGASAMFTAVTNYVQLRANVQDVGEAMRWLSGSLSAAAWDQVPLLGGAVVLLGGALLLGGRDLGVLRLGDEAAIGLGVDAARTRRLVLFAIVGLSAVAAASAGPIAFVALLSGPIAARLVGPTDRPLLGASALVGAVLVLAADIAGQHLAPTVLPVGVVTGLVGAPALLLQIRALNRKGTTR